MDKKEEGKKEEKMEKETRISLTRLIREIAGSDGVSAPIRRVRITRDILSFLSLNFKLVAIKVSKVSKGCFTICEYFSREFDSEFIVDTFFFLREGKEKNLRSSLVENLLKILGPGYYVREKQHFFPPFFFPLTSLGLSP